LTSQQLFERPVSENSSLDRVGRHPSVVQG
jgi:hypothetical protein